jgi:hypothetical protein
MNMFSKPKIPAAPAPTPMVDEEAVARAKKRATQRTSGKSGRTGTLLSGSLGTGEKLGD